MPANPLPAQRPSATGISVQAFASGAWTIRVFGRCGRN